MDKLIYITEDGGVTKKILIESDKDIVEVGQDLTLQFEISDTKGNLIDSTKDNKIPFIACLGNNEMIRGLELALRTMNIGETAEITISYKYAYGEAGLPPIVGPKTDLVYLITVADAVDRIKSKWEMSNAEILESVADMKQKGIQLFKETNFEQAVIQFKESLDFVDRVKGEDLEKAKNIKLSLNLNLANCFLKLNKVKKCIQHAETANKLSETPKAHYYIGQAQLKDKSFEKAEFSFTRLRNLLPENELNLADECDKQLAAAVAQNKKHEKGLFKSLFKNSTDSRINTQINPENPRVFMEIMLNRSPKYFEIEIELLRDMVPKTVDNFLRIVNGFEFEGITRKYSETKFFRLLKDRFLMGGDVITNNGKTNVGPDGQQFEDELLGTEIDRKGLVCLANNGANSNGSMFFITLGECNWLSGKHVVFGKIIKGLEMLDDINTMEVDASDKPISELELVNIALIN